MPSFFIENLRTMEVFRYDGPDFPTRNPSWGQPGGTRLKSQADQWELENGEDAGFSIQGDPMWTYHDAMTLVGDDYQADLDAQKANKKAKDAKKAREDRLKAIDITKLPTNLQDVVRDIIAEIKS